MASEKPPTKLPKVSQNQAQVVAVLVLLSALVLIIGGLYLAQAATDITNKNDIRVLEERRRRIERQNELLRAEIAELGSVDTMYVRAATLGYRRAGPEDMQWITVEGYVYNLPAPSPTPIVTPAETIFYEENFAGWLKRQFDNLRQEFDDWAN